jgi:hypothetical protein
MGVLVIGGTVLAGCDSSKADAIAGTWTTASADEELEYYDEATWKFQTKTYEKTEDEEEPKQVVLEIGATKWKGYWRVNEKELQVKLIEGMGEDREKLYRFAIEEYETSKELVLSMKEGEKAGARITLEPQG